MLGACLLDREALLAVTDSLRGDDFYEPRYKMAFELMEEMVAKDKAVDSLTFQEELTKRSLSEKFGGYPFITSLIDAVTTTANIDHYVAIVRDKSIHRGLVRVGSEIVRMGYSEDIPFDEALENSEQKVYEIKTFNVILGHAARSFFCFCPETIGNESVAKWCPKQ